MNFEQANEKVAQAKAAMDANRTIETMDAYKQAYNERAAMAVPGKAIQYSSRFSAAARSGKRQQAEMRANKGRK